MAKETRPITVKPKEAPKLNINPHTPNRAKDFRAGEIERKGIAAQRARQKETTKGPRGLLIRGEKKNPREKKRRNDIAANG